jgi:UBX domain-containing protein 1
MENLRKFALALSLSRSLALSCITETSLTLRHRQGGVEKQEDEQPREDETPINIVIYSNGFTVNDGPLRNPANEPDAAQFMKDLEGGRVPPEIVQQYGQVTFKFEVTHKREDYVAPPPKLVPFTGHGQALSSSGGGELIVNNNAQPPTVSSSAPTISVQVRLANGQRRVLKFNTTHTVHDLYMAVAE